MRIVNLPIPMVMVAIAAVSLAVRERACSAQARTGLQPGSSYYYCKAIGETDSSFRNYPVQLQSTLLLEDLEGFVENAALHNEFGLAPDQRKELEACKKLIVSGYETKDEIIRELWKELNTIHEDEFYLAAYRPLQQEIGGVQKKVYAVLTPNQRATLSQLFWRKRAIEIGLLPAISSDKTLMTELGEAGLRAIEKVMAEQREEILKLRTKLKETLRDDVRRILRPDQQKALDNYLGDYLPHCVESCELLQEQTREATLPMQGKQDAVKDCLAAPLAFRVDVLGRIFPIDKNGNGARLLAIIDSVAGADAEVLGYQLHKGYLEENRPTEKSKELAKETKRLQEKVMRLEMTHREYLTQMAAINSARAEERLLLFEESLLPHQSKLIRKVLCKRLITLRGPYWCLMHGSLGKELGITKEQRERLKTAAEERVKMLETELRGAERRLLIGVIESVPAEKRKLLIDRFPIVTDNMSPAPDAMVGPK